MNKRTRDYEKRLPLHLPLVPSSLSPILAPWRLGGSRTKLLVLTCLVGANLALAGPSLIENGGFEQLAGTQPADWEPLVIGAPAKFSLTQDAAEGRSCASIIAREISRAYWRSQPVRVAPGERLGFAAQVRSGDVPLQQKGTIIAIAEFEGPVAPESHVAKLGTAPPNQAWKAISGSVTVPAGATAVRLRLGFSYNMGQVWWDAVSLRPKASVVAMPALREGKLAPGTAVPVVVLNRSGRQGTVELAVRLDRQEARAKVELTGTPEQRFEVPIRIPGEGKHELAISMEGFDSGPIPAAVPPPLTLYPLTPTHWVAEDGTARCTGDVELAIAGPVAECEVKLVDSRGTVVASQRLSAAESVRFTLEAGQLPVGAYRVTVDAREQAGSVRTVEQPWHVVHRDGCRTTINAAGYPVKNGKAIFPLGIFNSEARLAECAAAGFNIAHFYNAARVQPGRRGHDQRLTDALNRVHAAGQYALLLVPMEYAIAGQWDRFTDRIRMFRNHPALLAWDEEEGLARGDMSSQVLERVRTVLQAEDPHHPFMIGDAKDVIGRISDRKAMFPTNRGDIFMWWWYPFPLQASAGNDLEGEQAGGGMLLDPPAFLGAGAGKPVWIGVQAYRKPGLTARYPTPVEYRAQAYLAVIGGAKGLMWYGGSVTGGVYGKPQEGHWTELQGVVREMAALAPVLMGPDLGRPQVAPPDSPVVGVIKEGLRGRMLLAVNRSVEPCRVRMGIGEAIEQVRLVGENRTVSAPDGFLTETFESLGVRVYEWGTVNPQTHPAGGPLYGTPTEQP